MRGKEREEFVRRVDLAFVDGSVVATVRELAVEQQHAAFRQNPSRDEVKLKM
jgi:hypothetical protein